MTIRSSAFGGTPAPWNGETPYSPGVEVYSPNTFQAYRRKTAAGPGVIVSNKSFEAGSSGWTVVASESAIENDPANARTGSWVFRISRTVGATSAVVATPQFACSPGHRFRVSAYGKCSGAANAVARVRVRFGRADGSLISTADAQFELAESSAGYIQKTAVGTAPPLTANVQVQIVEFGMTAGTWWFDDIDCVQIEPESDPDNWAPISGTPAPWNGETPYSPGVEVYSPNTFQAYRRKTAAGPGVIVSNKSFESGATGWNTPLTGCAIENDPTNARTGSWVFRISRTSGTTGVVTGGSYAQCLPGHVFRISAYAKCSASANASAAARIRFGRSDFSVISTVDANFTTAESSGGYILKSAVATAPPGTANVLVQIVDFGMTAGTWWFDDIDCVQIEPESDPGNWAPINGYTPIVRTEYTSGSGTHTYNAATRRARRVLVGAGGGGGRPQGGTGLAAAGGAGAGATVDTVINVTGGSSEAYVVGAAGPGATTNNTAGTAGGFTRLGRVVAPGGSAGGSSTSAGAGGFLGDTAGTSAQAPAFCGGGGGQGGSGGANSGNGGGAPGFRAASNGPTISEGGAASTNAGGGGGGSSPYGTGGNGGNGSATTGGAGGAATGYGAGGGGGGAGVTSGPGSNGTGGYILIEEFAQ